MGFRLARTARDRYALDDALFSSGGDLIGSGSDGAQRLAERLAPDDPAAQARVHADVSALGLLHDLGHRAVVRARSLDADGRGPLALALTAAQHSLGPERVRASLADFEQAFPATPTYRSEISARARLEASGLEPVLEELLLTWLGRGNPAARPYASLTDDPVLATAELIGLLDGLDAPAAAELPSGAPLAAAHALVVSLRAPILASPGSLAGQLRWVRVHWADWLDAADLLELDRHLSIIATIEREAWLRHRQEGGAASGEAAALDGFHGLDAEPEAFSPDGDWMAELVLLAKSTYVWLSQLSRAHDREISRLDQVPDAELDELRDRGITGLWLIGLWQRSPASGRMKRMRGDREAMASAYSVADYRIADELGGDDAWRDLRDRAAARGIRLAADMVPNHMGLDSDWVIEHPDRFLSSAHPPFEAYRFEGEDLSTDERVSIRIEDHYWDATDAAVVFQRTDRASGETRYIYHGNDGTSFPWNDTAQLDYLRADVREAVIGQVLEVARRFHVIRFDAAMVLARRHIQRLWYPQPGHDAGVPSREMAALSAEDFARLLPREFWREVVDRVAAEVPDTLLLAEAFWLMEGYFVRTLGMHRVYNSAFMHMLRDEQNAEYQQVIAETIAFDRRILGRYVNFMSNPDERTAIDQFGSEGKYFGVAALLATLPGLPMLGHGQVEGYSERYGMEFRHPRTDETPDERLVERHRREIFPLLQQRWRFADASAFRQLRALAGDKIVDDVFAFSNRAERAPEEAGERRSLVVYLNRYDRAYVRIDGAAAALDIDATDGDWLVLHDQRTGLQFLRHMTDTVSNGLELELDGYACHVFLGFELIRDSAGSAWARLAEQIGLQGVPDMHAAIRRLEQAPVRDAVADVFSSPAVTEALLPTATDTAVSHTESLLTAIDHVLRLTGSRGPAGPVLVERIERARGERPSLLARTVVAWALVEALVGGVGEDTAAWQDWEMAARLSEATRRAGASDEHAWRIVELTAALAAIAPGDLARVVEADGLPNDWFERSEVRAASGWNKNADGTWIVREAWDELTEALALRDAVVDPSFSVAAAVELRRRAAASGYRISGSA